MAAFPIQEYATAITVEAPGAQHPAGDKTAYQGSGFGIASFVAGIIAFPVYTLGSLDTMFTLGVSQFHVIAAIIALTALALGLVGIRKRLKGLAIAGMALSLLTLIPFVLLI